MKTLTTIVLALVLMVGVADAKKPAPPPPPDPDPVDVGTIYFTAGYAWDQMYQVESDGSGYAALDPAISGGAEPSLLRHLDSSGEVVRWFLQVVIRDGIEQLVVVSESGDEARIVDDTTLQVGGRGGSYAYPRWADDDRLISFCAVRRDPNVNPDDFTYPDADIVDAETGQYLLTIDPATMTPVGEPVFVPLPSWIRGAPIYELDEDGAPVLDENGDPIVIGFDGDMRDGARNLVSDLSRSGTSFVYQSYRDHKGTWRADAPDWTKSSFPALASGEFLYLPRWSPDASKVVGKTAAGIRLISAEGPEPESLVDDPDDSRRTVVVVDNPFWSPSGTHVLYRRGSRSTHNGSTTHEIHAVDVATGLTTFLREGWPRAWRAP